MTPDVILEWWFAGWDDALPLGSPDAAVARWTAAEEGTDPALDAEVRERFADLHAAVAKGSLDGEDTARGTLAKVLVLDQLSRVLHRSTGKAYSWDAEARAATQRALERAYDRELTLVERAFLYLPLTHAEDRTAHRRALLLYTDLAEEAEEAGVARADWYRSAVQAEQRLKEIIDRFGRDPHRNLPLERTSTPEELEFLSDDTE
jgi:uncharacterized protein (DUF924 family)